MGSEKDQHNQVVVTKKKKKKKQKQEVNKVQCQKGNGFCREFKQKQEKVHFKSLKITVHKGQVKTAITKPKGHQLEQVIKNHNAQRTN